MHYTKIISIVGCGGKSTLLKNLALNSNHNKILVTTSTKMLKSQLSFADYINEYDVRKDGIYAYYNNFSDSKCSAIDTNKLESLIRNFDLVLIEADGCRNKLGKLTNREFEPNILDISTTTVGIVNLSILNQKVSEKNTFNFDLTTKETYSAENIFEYINDENGLFKNSKGNKILCLIKDDYHFINLDDNFESNYFNYINKHK